MKIVITGGCGFLGHHVVEHFLKDQGPIEHQIVVLDKLEHSGALDRLRDIRCFREENVLTLACDLSQPLQDGVKKELVDADVVFHIAAESHVDRSIDHPAPFIQNNVMSTVHILDWIRSLKIPDRPVFFYFSTDEVYGPAPAGVFHTESTVHTPKNPYAASKSASEQVVTAYTNTYGLATVITRCMNIFGERQHPEKFIPLVIRKVLDGEVVQVHSDPTRRHAGSRFYIHARNVAAALAYLLNRLIDGFPFEFGESFNIVGEREVDNLTLAKMIADIIGKPLKHEMVDFHSSRPGHDLRYAMSGAKLADLGWTVPVHLENSLKKTVEWTLNNQRWLRA